MRTPVKAPVYILILLFVGATAVAGNRSVATKDWTFTNTGNGTALAYTSNDSGSTLGIYCAAANNCDAYLRTSTGCEDKSKYPALINSDSGANGFDITCTNISAAGEKPDYVFVFNDFNNIKDLMLKDHALGIALPLASGQFKVARFSLNGSNEALAAVSSVIASDKKGAERKETSSKKTIDETI